MKLADSHCHLDMLKEKSLDEILSEAAAASVEYILNVCVSCVDFPNVLAIAKQYPNVWASFGIHPNEQEEEPSFSELLMMGAHEKVVAIGETGLDYYRSEGDLEWQRNRFRDHIRAAISLKKPLIIHTRAAIEDTMQILRDEQAESAGGVMHCFGEDWQAAKQALDMGFYISFSGIVTFKNADGLREVAKRVPLDRLLIETDAPYLAPEPKRGKQNLPAYARFTAEYLANLREESLDLFAEQTTQNFFTLFKGAKVAHV